MSTIKTVTPGILSVVLLAEDATGTGHRWRLIDDQPWRRMYVELADGGGKPD